MIGKNNLEKLELHNSTDALACLSKGTKPEWRESLQFFSRFKRIKELDNKNKDLAKMAILGMVGDMLEKEIGKLNNGILEDGEIKRKRGLLIYPSTRPLNRTLEYSSHPFIPGVTGNNEGVTELLRETGIETIKGKYKSIIELNDKNRKVFLDCKSGWF